MAFVRRHFHKIDAHFAHRDRAGHAAVRLGSSQKCTNARQKFFCAEGFYQIVVSAAVEAGYAIGDLSFCGDHQDGSSNRKPAKLGAERVAIELRHHHVEQDEVWLLLDGELQTRQPIGRGLYPVAFRIENVAQRDAHGVLVFDDEDPGAHRGNSRPKRLPRPMALSTITRPPCASAACFTMLSPMPVPSVSRRSSGP